MLQIETNLMTVNHKSRSVTAFIVQATGGSTCLIQFYLFLSPEPSVIKLFTVVIYCTFKVLPAFRVIKLYYHGDYCGMAVNYHGICVTNVIKHNLT